MKQGDLFFPSEFHGCPRLPYPRHMLMIQATGEYRPVKAGEWFISGAIPEGYYQPTDSWLDQHIGRLVRVSVTLTVQEVL